MKITVDDSGEKPVVIVEDPSAAMCILLASLYQAQAISLNDVSAKEVKRRSTRLTPEILLKNGFVDNQKHQRYVRGAFFISYKELELGTATVEVLEQTLNNYKPGGPADLPIKIEI